MVMEQIVRGTPSSNQGVCASEHQANTETATPKHKRGRPKGSAPEQKRCRAQWCIEATSNNGQRVATTGWQLDTPPLFCA